MTAPPDGATGTDKALTGDPAIDPSEPREHRHGFHTILVVDDEVGIREGCEAVLTADGHAVLLAASAEEGLEVLRENPQTDLALVDMRMPGAGGLEFLAGAREIAPETVCVVMTAYATLDAAIESTKRGAFDLITKPFTSDQLIPVVNSALANAHLRRERNRVQAQKDMRMLEVATEQTRLRTIIDCMADGVIVCNADNKLVLFNPMALRVLPHVKPQECVLELSDAMEPPELVEMINEASAGHNRLSREIQLTDSSEAGVWMVADVAPVIDEGSGQFLGTVTVLRDISELKRVEELKAQFVNMVAHELRAPLSAVSGYLSVMLEGMVSDPETQKGMLARSNERVKALLDLVSDLLDVSRMEAGTIRREITSESIGEIVREVAELMEPLADEKQVRIEIVVPDGLRRIEADREELIRLFNNLVSNAIKYNKTGGRVSISAAEDGHFVRIDVTDTGLGISEDGLERLFSEFFREKRPETAYVTGTGLGLSIVKRIVDFYHGRLAVDSKLGEGSTFKVWLPCRYEAKAPKNGLKTEEPVPQARVVGDGTAAPL